MIPRSHPPRRDQYPDGYPVLWGECSLDLVVTPVFVETGHPAAPRVYTRRGRDLVLGALNGPFKSSAWHIPLTIAIFRRLRPYRHLFPFGPGNSEGYTVRFTLFPTEVGRIRKDSIQARIPLYAL